MRLLVNKDIPLACVRLLREVGHDVVTVTERSPGIPDDEVMRLARDEVRIIVTCDRDYGELIYRQRLPAPTGVLYLRFLPASPREPADYLARLIADGIELEGKFTTGDREQVRQRPLPREQGWAMELKDFQQEVLDTFDGSGCLGRTTVACAGVGPAGP